MLQKCPECPETAPLGPGRSWKLLEGHGRFRAVPPTALRPWPWGASHLGFPGRPDGGGAPGGNPPPGGITDSHYGFRREVLEGLEGLGVQVGLPTSLGRRPRPLGHLYKVSQGGGETQVPGAPWPPSF